MKIYRDSSAWTSGALVLLSAAEAMAGAPRTSPPGDGCAGCAACGGSLAALIAIPIVLLVLNIALLVWVARDARSRGMDSSVLWMFLVFFTGLLGLIIYLFSRPQGNLVGCPHCKGNRLAAAVKCPHCGNAGAVPGAPPGGGYGPSPGSGYGPPPGGGYGPPPGGGGYGPPPGGGGYGPPPGGGGYGPPPGGGGYGPPPGAR